MKLRRVLTQNGPQVEALKSGESDEWIRLSTVAGLSDISKSFAVNDNLATHLMSVLELGHDGWQVLSEQVDACEAVEGALDADVILPFKPSSFRDFLLFEQHFIDASRGFVKRFLPKKYKITALYERITNKTFPKFKPPAIWYERPLYYFGNHLNFMTSGEYIHIPDYTKALDYELELGAILAGPLLNATPDEATKAIGGYVVLNDLSARDVQFPEMRSGFGPQKAKHFQNAMSPIVVTADEINDSVDNLDASVLINGIKRIPCSTSNMQYSLGEAIAYVSKSEQLHAGELFGSGTLPGGSGMENGCWLQAGSVLHLAIDKVGELTNQVV
ncbi:MAG: fumarylacetoacetate hydrolase family protein [Gammaproteobacteria bacterium]|nr:fumarylacetoacetate hydrolase family protein [Gammaproteobacteria bacterium]